MTSPIINPAAAPLNPNDGTFIKIQEKSSAREDDTTRTRAIFSCLLIEMGTTELVYHNDETTNCTNMMSSSTESVGTFPMVHAAQAYLPMNATQSARETHRRMESSQALLCSRLARPKFSAPNAAEISGHTALLMSCMI